MEPSTKKGLIIGGSIAAVVLIGASIGIGIAVSGNGSSNGSNAIEVWGYNDQVSSTSKKVNKYMGLTFQEEIGYFDSSKWEASAEGTLLNNSHYHSVNEDIEILDGVHGAATGLGYLSSTWVGGYTDDKGNGDQFKMLKLYDNGVEAGVAPPTEPSRSDATNYLDPTNEAEKIAYSEINSVASTIVGEETGATYSIGSEPMQATLNTTMKVTPTIADWLRPNIGTGNALVAVEGEDSGEFANWLFEENLTDEFVVSYGLFNYMAFDITNIENINSMSISGSNEAGKGDLEAGWYTDVLEVSYQNLMGDTSADLAADVIAQQNSTSGAYSIKVDGTGTNSGIMKQEISNYQADFRTASSNDEIVFEYDLNNGGSGEAWTKPTANIGDDLLIGDPNSSGRNDAFIGTSSRASRTSEVEKFGYEAIATTIPNDGSGDVYVSPEKSTNGQILAYTMGIDLPVFFVNKGMNFEYTVTETSLPCIENATEKGVKVGDTITVTPTGMSDKGGKEIYENGASWVDVLDQGLILVEAV